MAPPAILDSRYSWLRLTVTVLIGTIANVGIWSIIVVLPDMQAEFGIGRAEASVPYVLTMVGFALGNYLMGEVVDRNGIVRALMLSALLIGVATWGAAVSPSVLVLSICQFAIGLGTATSFGPLIADISHWFQRRRGIAVALAASGNYLSGAFWPIVLAGVIATHGWRAAYLVLATVVVLSVIPLALLLRRPVPEEARSHSQAMADANVRAVAFGPRTLTVLLSIAGIGCCMAMSMPQVHIVAYCTDLGYGPAVGAEMLSLMLLGGVASRLVSGLVADRLGGVRTLLIGSALQCIALFLYLPWDGLVSLYVISTIFGLAQGGIVPSYALIVREYLPPAEAASKVGLVMMMTVIGMAAGGWVSGWIYDVSGSYQLAFVNGIAWNFVNIGIMVLILMRSGRRRALAPA
jgi:MFS family permease